MPNGEALLKPGTFARVHIETAREDRIVTVPYASLQYRYGVNRVFVVDKGKPVGIVHVHDLLRAGVA